jgi:hypothetical protein
MSTRVDNASSVNGHASRKASNMRCSVVDMHPFPAIVLSMLASMLVIEEEV